MHPIRRLEVPPIIEIPDVAKRPTMLLRARVYDRRWYDNSYVISSDRRDRSGDRAINSPSLCRPSKSRIIIDFLKDLVYVITEYQGFSFSDPRLA